MMRSRCSFGLLTVSRGALLAGALTVSACGAHGHPPTSSTTSSATGPAAGAPATLAYQLHMDFFSHESHLASVIDPQVFVSAPGAPADTGPQKIPHSAGVAPAAKTDPPDTPLLAADGTPLQITLGQWESAAGSVALTCNGGQ